MRILIILLSFILLASGMLYAQQVNTLYFIENTPIRHKLNPAFQPTTSYYISLPIIGYSQFQFGNNSVTLKDIIYKYDGKTISFLNATGGNIDGVYNQLSSTSVIRANAETNLLGFGFRSRKNVYWTFSISEKFDAALGLPKDLFKLGFYGTPDSVGNSFDLRTLQGNISLYTETALGYAKQLNNKWSVGVKAKFLIGTANISNSNKDLRMEAGIDRWNLKSEGSIHVSSPYILTVDTDSKRVWRKSPEGLSDWFKPAGFGLGLDLGVEYQYSPNLKLSAALLDLGFIRWSRNVQNINYSANYNFDGLLHYSSTQSYLTASDDYERLFKNNNLLDSLSADFKKAYTLQSGSTNSYFTTTTFKLNLAAEYILLNNKLSLGLLSRSFFIKNAMTQEFTVSANARPVSWFNGSLSYSVLGGHFSSLGAGIGVRTGFMHWFAAADYIPFQTASYNLDGNKSGGTEIPIPYNVKSINFAMGVNIVFNSNKPIDKYTKNNSASKDCKCNW